MFLHCHSHLQTFCLHSIVPAMAVSQKIYIDTQHQYLVRVVLQVAESAACRLGQVSEPGGGGPIAGQPSEPSSRQHRCITAAGSRLGQSIRASGAAVMRSNPLQPARPGGEPHGREGSVWGQGRPAADCFTRSAPLIRGSPTPQMHPCSTEAP